MRIRSLLCTVYACLLTAVMKSRLVNVLSVILVASIPVTSLGNSIGANLFSTAVSKTNNWALNLNQNSSTIRAIASAGRSAPSINTQRSPRSATTQNNEQDVVLSYTEDGVNYKGTYKTEKSMYFERAANYRVRSIQAELTSNVRQLLSVWGVELEEIILKKYDGARQLPFENPTRAQYAFNQSLARGYLAPNSSENVDVFLPRIKNITPGGMFDKLGAQVGDYIQRIFEGPTYASRNMSVTGFRSLESLVADIDTWASENTQPYRYTIILSRLGDHAQDLFLETAIVPSAYASFTASPEPRKNQIKYANLLPRDSLAHSRNLVFQQAKNAVLIRSIAEGSFARFLFWQNEDNDLFLERLNEIIFPAAAEAYSDICRSSLVDPTTYTPVRNVFKGEEGAGTGFVTRYYEQVEGKTIYLERAYLNLYQSQIANIIPTMINIHRELMSDVDLVPFMYDEAFPTLFASTDEFREFFNANGCNPVASQFMANFWAFLEGKPQAVEGEEYPTKIEIFAEAEEHLVAYVPSNKWPNIETLSDTNYFGVQVVGRSRVEGNLIRMSVGLTELYSSGNYQFDRNKEGMPEAVSEVFTTKSKGLECVYFGRPGYTQSRYFWYEMHPRLSASTIKLISESGVESIRRSCPLRYADN